MTNFNNGATNTAANIANNEWQSLTITFPITMTNEMEQLKAEVENVKVEMRTLFCSLGIIVRGFGWS